MPDLMSTSISGLAAFQRAIDVTGHNIANANTPGYSRQVAEFATRAGQGTGIGYIGAGVDVSTIKRNYDAILGLQLQSSTTSYSRYDTMNSLASRLDSLLADTTTGLNGSLQSFFGSVQDVANDPASVPTRQVLLGEADSLVSRFRELDGQMAGIDEELNGRLTAGVATINQLADSIAGVNRDIVLAQGRTNQPPNDLLDQRDQLVRNLAEQVSVDTVMQDNGSMNVFIGNGQNLVVGNDVHHLAVVNSEFDPTRLELAYQDIGGTTPIHGWLNGGVLGGLLDFREQILDPARAALGQTARAVTTSFNEQHAAGMDLNGMPGGDFFAIDPPAVAASSNNSGSGTATVSIDDLGAITGADYVLEYDGAAYSLTSEDSGESVTLSGSGTTLDPFVGAGLSIVVSGAPAAGDRQLIRPAIGSVESMRRALENPQDIAMAAPTRTSAELGNLGDATISQSQVTDASDPNLLSSAVIEFTTPTSYSIDGAGSFAYVSGEPIAVNGSSFAISGVPVAGDRFTLDANTGASGDNRNGLLLADVQTVGLLDGGTVSVSQKYGQLVSNAGASAHQVQVNLDAQGVIRQNSEDALLESSGVNLDEEAANLIRYQQSYQAMAQAISIASTLFNTLLAATAR